MTQPQSQALSGRGEGKAELTPDQVEALRWIDRNDTHSSGWLTNGKPARGEPSKWNAIQCSGPRGSIVIPVEDWEMIRDLVTCGIGTDRDRSIHILNDKGRAALAKATAA